MSSSSVPAPPEKSLVIGRALCLSTLVVRGQLESAVLLANGPEDVAAYVDLARRLNHWLNDQDFTAQFTLDELDMLSLTPGSWAASQHDAQTERVEQLGVLRWALSLQESFAPYDQPFPFPDLQAALGWAPEAINSPRHEKLAAFPCNGTELLTGLAELRPQPSMAAQRAAAECWQWRVNVAQLERSGTPAPKGQPYGMMIGIAAEEAHAAAAIPRPVQNDFPLNGRPFAKAPEAEQARCGQLASWRAVALDWLCGYATTWDAVPVAAAA